MRAPPALLLAVLLAACGGGGRESGAGVLRKCQPAGELAGLSRGRLAVQACKVQRRRDMRTDEFVSVVVYREIDGGLAGEAQLDPHSVPDIRHEIERFHDDGLDGTYESGDLLYLISFHAPNGTAMLAVGSGKGEGDRAYLPLADSERFYRLLEKAARDVVYVAF